MAATAVLPPPTYDDGTDQSVKRLRTDGQARRGNSALCRYFQKECCWYDGACTYVHAPGVDANGYKTTLCEGYMVGRCVSGENCVDAHGKEELLTPTSFEGQDGYKWSLCTFFMLEDTKCAQASHNCFYAHGHLDLRRPLVTLPGGLGHATFTYSDAHVHLDQVLLGRRYGALWMYKRSLCRHRPCVNKYCTWSHGAHDTRPRLPFDSQDLVLWASELDALPNANFGACVHSSCEVATIDESVQLLGWGREMLGSRIYGAFGIHPTYCELYTPEVEQMLEAAVDKCGKQAVAWGECGLDYYHQGALDVQAYRAKMYDVFVRQAQVAVRRRLPLIVHSRDAEVETFQALRDNVPSTHPVYLHSFQGPIETLLEFLKTFPCSCVGIPGCITFKYADHSRAMARAVPLERILLETDGPYMAPEPYRFDRSHSGYIPWIADGVARAKGISVLEVLAVTHSNFLRFYNL